MMRPFLAVPVLLAPVLLSLVLAHPLVAQDRADDERELLQLHRELLEAHRSGDVDRWMAVESPTWVSANGGRVAFSTEADRRAQRAAYLAGATFDVYRDLREPLVRVSDDGSLAWVIVEVEVRGTMDVSGAAPEPFHDVWAWVELYAREDGVWKMVGNASNRRPGEAAGGERPATAEVTFASIPDALATRGPGAWLEFFEGAPSFFMASDGEVAFADRAEAEAFLAGFAPTVAAMTLQWIDPRFETLAADLVVVTSGYDEQITMVDGTVSAFGGRVSGLLRRRGGAWRLQHLHWSSPAPGGP